MTRTELQSLACLDLLPRCETIRYHRNVHLCCVLEEQIEQETLKYCRIVEVRVLK